MQISVTEANNRSGSGRGFALGAGAGNSRRSNPASSSESGSGQLSPCASARRMHFPTVAGNTFRLRATDRRLILAA